MTVPPLSRRHGVLFVVAATGGALAFALAVLVGTHRTDTGGATAPEFDTAPAFGESAAIVLHDTEVHEELPSSSSSSNDSTIRVAFGGNSILYYNDCPRLMEQMLQTDFSTVVQDSCLRPASTLRSLFDRGNNMAGTFNTTQALLPDGSYDLGAPTITALINRTAPWDFIVLNDRTQAPARQDTAERTREALLDRYAPLLLSTAPTTAILFIQTAAYRIPGIRDTEDLGDFEDFSDKLKDGYESYVATLKGEGVDARIAPVGEAYRWFYQNNQDIFNKLYSWDDFHPSPYGTYLQACCIFVTMVPDIPPPAYNSTWWERSRVMQPADEEPLPRPTDVEAAELRRVACMLCGDTGSSCEKSSDHDRDGPPADSESESESESGGFRADALGDSTKTEDSSSASNSKGSLSLSSSKGKGSSKPGKG